MVAIVKADIISTATLNSKGSPVPLTLNNMNSGMVLAVSVIRNGTRTSIGSVTRSNLFDGTFTKLRDDTYIKATCTVFGSNFNSGNCAVGLCYDRLYWDYGVAYQYDGQWTRANQTTIVMGSSKWTTATTSSAAMAAGTHTIQFGWNPINGATGEAPFNVFNPNSTDDYRNQQMVSSIVIYEVYP